MPHDARVRPQHRQMERTIPRKRLLHRTSTQGRLQRTHERKNTTRTLHPHLHQERRQTLRATRRTHRHHPRNRLKRGPEGEENPVVTNNGQTRTTPERKVLQLAVQRMQNTLRNNKEGEKRVTNAKGHYCPACNTKLAV